jgi:hypothetical protein
MKKAKANFSVIKNETFFSLMAHMLLIAAFHKPPAKQSGSACAWKRDASAC